MTRSIGAILLLAACSSKPDPEPPAPSAPPPPVTARPAADASANLVTPVRQVEITAGDVWTIDTQCGPTLGKDIRVGETVRTRVEAFRIDETVVTCEHWAACAATKACWDDEKFCRHGKAVVPRAEAAMYCRWRGARLPSWPEWYRAVRGDSRQRFPMGEAFDDKLACERPTIAAADGPKRCEFTSAAGVTYAMRNPHRAEWTRDEICVLERGAKMAFGLGVGLSGDKFDYPYFLLSRPSELQVGYAEFRCVTP